MSMGKYVWVVTADMSTDPYGIMIGLIGVFDSLDKANEVVEKITDKYRKIDCRSVLLGTEYGSKKRGDADPYIEPDIYIASYFE